MILASAFRSRLPAGLALLFALSVATVAPSPARAQGFGPSAAGFAAGTAAGVVWTVGGIVAGARFADSYVWTANQLLKWPLVGTLAGTVTGTILGSTDRDALGRASLGALVGGVGGAGLGALAGRTWLGPGGGWAGAFVGGGLGTAVGWIAGALVEGDDEADRREAVTFTFRVPWGFGR